MFFNNSHLDMRPATLQKITVVGTDTDTTTDLRETVVAIFNDRLGPLDWTETSPLSEGRSAENHPKPLDVI